jgi:hypothetical protein
VPDNITKAIQWFKTASNKKLGLEKKRGSKEEEIAFAKGK